MTNKEYGALIRKLRQNAHLSQKELGMACGYDEASADVNVRSWESGKMLPTLRRIRDLAHALHCSLETLIP